MQDDIAPRYTMTAARTRRIGRVAAVALTFGALGACVVPGNRTPQPVPGPGATAPRPPCPAGEVIVADGFTADRTECILRVGTNTLTIGYGIDWPDDVAERAERAGCVHVEVRADGIAYGVLCAF